MGEVVDMFTPFCEITGDDGKAFAIEWRRGDQYLVLHTNGEVEATDDVFMEPHEMKQLFGLWLIMVDGEEGS